MKFSLIICTYMRPKPLLSLLQSVQTQTLYPDEILIIDGSTNQDTEQILIENQFKNLHYFLVPDKHRGLTKQRNFGIERVGSEMQIVCFLDDDVVLESDYFEQLIKTYQIYPEAFGVGGYIINETKSEFVGDDYIPKIKDFFYDGWKRKDSVRFIIRKILGLDSDCKPGFFPAFGHERSVSFLPPSGKIYESEMLMGGVSSFKKSVFESIQFSNYFEGYGLYEDADFTLRLSKTGKLFVNTNAKLNHYHDVSGRPNQYQYGKMVVRNGWYVWRVKNTNPKVIAKLKWHFITLLLAFIRLVNTVTTSKSKTSFTEAIGRIVGWFSLFWDKPNAKESGVGLIQQIKLISSEKKIDIFPISNSENKWNIVIPKEFQNAAFDVEITFQDSIEKIRNFDYQWIDADNDFIATNLVPKIIKLSNGLFVQPNLNIGVWEFNKKHKNKISWKFNHPDASVFTVYKSDSCYKIYRSISSKFIDKPLFLLFSNVGAIEFSRSKIPFSAVACFTDHCDFDTLENLKLQRKLLKESGIIVTKGFFLNHFSKRNDNASWQNNNEELKKWLNDGHELAYHSLSQSIKSDEESATDFLNFKSVENVVTWIDHGFQPYNFSSIENTKIISQNTYFQKLNSEKIFILWNYIDSATSTTGVLNQLNPSHFTLSKYWEGSLDSPIFDKIQRFVKNCIFHYYADEKLIDNYKSISLNIKKIIFDHKIKEIPIFIRNSIKVFLPLLKIILFWSASKNRVYRYAKYNSIIFPYIIKGNTFRIFQTIEILDLIKSLSSKNIDLLIQEKGLFIGHTYFSVPMKYHTGRMFIEENMINEKVVENFMYLGEKIKNNEIWNPTLNELVVFLNNFENLVLDVDIKGNIFLVNDTVLPYRIIN